MSGLKYIGCVGNRVESVDQFKLDNSSFVSKENITGTALELVETSAYLVKSLFNYNKGDKERRVICQDDS